MFIPFYASQNAREEARKKVRLQGRQGKHNARRHNERNQQHYRATASQLKPCPIQEVRAISSRPVQAVGLTIATTPPVTPLSYLQAAALCVLTTMHVHSQHQETLLAEPGSPGRW